MDENLSKPASENHQDNKDSETLATRPSFPASPLIHSSQALWTKLIQGKWVLLFSIVAFGLFGLMLGAIRVPLFRAQTSIEVESPTGHWMLSGADAPAQESYLQRQIRIIESRSLLERTLAKLNEADRVRLFEAPRFWWSSDSYDQRLETLRRHISAQASEQAGVIDVTLLAPDAAAAAYLLNSLTQELADFDIERAWRASRHDQQWTDRQLAELRRKWEQSEQVLAEYSRSAGVEGDRALSHSDPPAWETSDPELRELKHTFTGLRTQIAEWESLYGSSSPEASKLRSQLRDAGIAIRQRRELLLKEADKPVSFAQTDSGPLSHQDAVIRLNTLKQEAETNHQIFDLAATRFKEAAVTAASHMGAINVVDPAVPETRPVTPNRLLYGGLGGFTGLLIGIAFVGLRDRFSPTFDDPALLSRYLGLQVLGTIPATRFSDDAAGYNFAPNEPALNLAFGSNAYTSEAYRTIRSSILLKVGRHELRRLIFTSAGHSDGKTTVVANLGAALASAQRRVLLVDGDLRDPGLHKVFGTDNEHGLADLLSRQIPATPMASREFIRATQIPGLFLLSAGQAGERAPEILSSVHLHMLIRECAKSFDIVLIDSSPVLPYADSRSLAHACDGVVLIVRAASTDRRAALRARDVISQDGAPLIGTILNDWDASRSASA